MARITTKWPLLLVQGKPVTTGQADDILLRTCGAVFTGNDHAWELQIAGILGVGVRAGAPCIDHDSAAAWYKRIGGLDLHYLGNRRIYSAWVGGPKGWCDWDGQIGCGNYNIGKWPGVSGVESDLAAIAAAFPYLDMRVQLAEDEGDGSLCGEWRVWNGQMMETEPGGVIQAPPLDVTIAAAGLAFGAPGRERGVSPERLARASARVLAAHGQP
jgi:hypothetical protein